MLQEYKFLNLMYFWNCLTHPFFNLVSRMMEVLKTLKNIAVFLVKKLIKTLKKSTLNSMTLKAFLESSIIKT